MTILGLNSPEIFLILSIFLVIIGTKRIEKGLYLFSKILKFLLSNQSWDDLIGKKKIIEEISSTNLENPNPAKKIKEIELVNNKIEKKELKEITPNKTIKEVKSAKKIKEAELVNEKIVTTDVKEADKAKPTKGAKPAKILGEVDTKNNVSSKTKRVVTRNKKKEI